MTAYVKWLPVGHVTHGYRRVFAIYENDNLRHVVNLALMPYELVFKVREYGGADAVTDPSLWWGLSLIAQLTSRGTLLGPENPDNADDGYLQIRPELLPVEDMIPLVEFQNAVTTGSYVISE